MNSVRIPGISPEEYYLERALNLSGRLTGIKTVRHEQGGADKGYGHNAWGLPGRSYRKVLQIHPDIRNTNLKQSQ